MFKYFKLLCMHIIKSKELSLMKYVRKKKLWPRRGALIINSNPWKKLNRNNIRTLHFSMFWTFKLDMGVNIYQVPGIGRKVVDVLNVLQVSRWTRREYNYSKIRIKLCSYISTVHIYIYIYQYDIKHTINIITTYAVENLTNRVMPPPLSPIYIYLVSYYVTYIQYTWRRVMWEAESQKETTAEEEPQQEWVQLISKWELCGGVRCIFNSWGGGACFAIKKKESLWTNIRHAHFGWCSHLKI